MINKKILITDPTGKIGKPLLEEIVKLKQD
jgi:hypothetical protein